MSDSATVTAGAHAGEPIAIVGMACRLPMAPDPAAFWRLLRGGTDAVTDAPAHRRADNPLYDPDSPAPVPAFRGGFLDQIDRFDAECFGISPREALMMDPQQRLMLELSWEAIEDARIATDALRDTGTGVFVGTMSDDYAVLVRGEGPAAATHHTITGLHRGTIANRVSYVLGLRGPSLSVDSGQSSSLLAVHLAGESLRRGECELALAAGVQLNIVAQATMEAVAFGGLSPSGRCATFDASADGYVRGEGGGVVVLKPLPRAVADGDRIYCVILGSASNHDGAAEGLTVPDRAAQEEVLRLACQRAGVRPRDVQYVELHGTGTKVGDPVEAAALGAVFGPGRPSGDPLVVGSAKTNVGHLEGAAGIVGLLKASLSLAHGQIPPSLHFQAPNPRIPLDALRLRVQRELTPWPGRCGPMLAGVSSFGMGGANSHVVLAGPPAADDRPARPATGTAGRPAVLPCVFSGTGERAVRARAAQNLTDAAEGADEADIGFSLATTRAALGQRAAVVSTDSAGFTAGLRAVAAGQRHRDAVRGAPVDGGLAVLFSGQGFQRPGMGRELHDAFPAFARALDEVCEELDAHLDRPLREVMWADPDTPAARLLDETAYTQPALFAIETALYRLMESFGVRPDALAGHSVGEFAAAHVAGVLALADAAALVAARGRLMQALPAGGAMIALQASEAEVVAELEHCAGRVAVAAINGPASVVISGEEEAVTRVAERFRDSGRKAKRLKVSHAFHSPLMEPALDGLRSAARNLRSGHPGRAPVVSAVTGQPATPEQLGSPDYWAEHARQPVRFADCLATLYGQGIRSFLEIGPGQGLAAIGQVNRLGPDATFTPCLHGEAEERAVVMALAHLHARGTELDWPGFFGPGVHRVGLPSYPFQRDRYWLQAGAGRADQGPTADRADQSPGRAGAAADAGNMPGPGLAEQLAGLAPAQRRRAVREVVAGNVAAVLGHDRPDSVEPTRPFKDLGFDSRMTVELATRIGDATGLTLPAAVVYDHPTPARLADHLHAELAGARPDDTATGAAPVGREPIAVVAMACRYPGGARSPADLWELVAQGKDAITPFPGNRGWDLDALYDPEPGRPGRSYTRHGGFLDDADQFDPGFFEISQREAVAMDPQQRILLETCWEALERGGLVPGRLRGRPVGVFVGATSQDYGPRLHEAADGSGGYLLTGTTPSVASGRVAYAMGFEGPAMTVDTACSSSLVALHLARKALDDGECELALACGITVMASPGMFVEFSRQRGLAPDGRCKPFASAADGTAWAEGAGVLVLERLADARRNGHAVLAVVRGSAVNQDGASNGLTAPNGKSQEAVIRRALASAGVSAADVDAVEAHGTGTALGDPIEAGALIATYGREKTAGPPLWLGSLKSNIGHAQAAAGVAGVIKMVEAMRHGLLPATLHVNEPSGYVDWSAGHVRLLTEPVPWPDHDRVRRGAVSSFGISGSNAHVILEEAPAEEPAGDRRSPVQDGGGGLLPWVISAKTEESLRAQAARLHEFVTAQPGLRPGDVGFSLATTRSQFSHRAAVLGRDSGELAAGLSALAGGRAAAEVTRATAGTGGTVFVFPGQGSQWPGMAVELLGASPAFRDRMAECAEALAPFTGWSLPDVLREEPGAPPLSRVDVVQPALFAIMVSLAAWWRSMGVEPAAVVGHSQGEIAAACVAGALSLQDAARVVALRSKELAGLAGTGAMASIPLPAAAVRDRLARVTGGKIQVAAVNGTGSTAIAGEPAALGEFVASCQAEGIRARTIDVDYASHTTHVEGLRDALNDLLAGITPRPGDVPFYSTVTPGPLDTRNLDAGYWYENIRRTVEFEQATRGLIDDGHTLFIEVSPHPVLAMSIAETAEGTGSDAAAVGTLRRDHGGPGQLLTALAEAHVHGAPVAWERVFPGARRVELPTYPFRRRRCWLEAPAQAGQPAPGGSVPAGHPMAETITELADGGLLMAGRLSPRTQPWLADHTVAGTVLLPGTGFLELALEACRQAGGSWLEELALEAPLVLPADTAVVVQVAVGGPDESGRQSLTIDSRPEEPAGASWTRNASGTLTSGTPDAGPGPASGADPGRWPPAGAEPLDLGDAYDRLSRQGYGYGPAFRGLRGAWRLGDDVLAEVAAPPGLVESAASFSLHPALLDAALHALLLADGDPDARRIRLPFSWRGARLHAAGAAALRVRLSPDGPQTASLAVTDASGVPVARIDGLTFQPVAADRLGHPSRDGLFRLDWTELAGPPQTTRDRWAVLGEDLLGLCPPHASYPDVTALWAAVADGAHVPDAAIAACPPGAARTAGLADADSGPAPRVLALLQSWLDNERAGAAGQARLVVVTRNALAAAPGDTVEGLAQAPVWGLVRSAQSENPGRFVLVDIDGSAASVRALNSAVTSGEVQLAIRGGRVLVPRLARRDSSESLTPPAEGGPWRLDTVERGTLDGLALLPCSQAAGSLAPGEVRIAVRAAGLNFRDAAIALGLLPGEEGMGIEGAGVVAEVGEDVTGLAAGDHVLGLFDGAFGPLAVADSRTVARMPSGWTFPQAASVPVVFSTAYQCLAEVAGLRPGEAVLVHAAAGGVGMAAVQLARHLGAEVFATANPGKWDHLRAMGLDDDHIASSRSAEFSAKFRSVTGGRGVDVVLNSLTGELTDASLRLLRDGGRFVEIGKTDIRDAAAVARDWPGVSYRAYNLRDSSPDRIR